MRWMDGEMLDPSTNLPPLSFPTHSCVWRLKRRKVAREEKKSRTRKRRAESHLTSPSTSHSKHLASIAAVIYDEDNGASERSKRVKLNMPASRIGRCILPILESGMSSCLLLSNREDLFVCFLGDRHGCKRSSSTHSLLHPTRLP